MNDFKLKLIVSILGAIAFSFIFIILTFTLPTTEKKEIVLKKKAKNRLEEVSKSMMDR